MLKASIGASAQRKVYRTAIEHTTDKHKIRLEINQELRWLDNLQLELQGNEQSGILTNSLRLIQVLRQICMKLISSNYNQQQENILKLPQFKNNFAHAHSKHDSYEDVDPKLIKKLLQTQENHKCDPKFKNLGLVQVNGQRDETNRIKSQIKLTDSNHNFEVQELLNRLKNLKSQNSELSDETDCLLFQIQKVKIPSRFKQISDQIEQTKSQIQYYKQKFNTIQVRKHKPQNRQLEQKQQKNSELQKNLEKKNLGLFRNVDFRRKQLSQKKQELTNSIVKIENRCKKIQEQIELEKQKETNLQQMFDTASRQKNKQTNQNLIASNNLGMRNTVADNKVRLITSLTGASQVGKHIKSQMLAFKDYQQKSQEMLSKVETHRHLTVDGGLDLQSQSFRQFYYKLRSERSQSQASSLIQDVKKSIKKLIKKQRKQSQIYNQELLLKYQQQSWGLRILHPTYFRRGVLDQINGKFKPKKDRLEFLVSVTNSPRQEIKIGREKTVLRAGRMSNGSSRSSSSCKSSAYNISI